MRIRNVEYYRGRPFFLYKILQVKPDIAEFKRKIKGIQVYYIPIYNQKTHRNEYAIYLNKRITWY